MPQRQNLKPALADTLRALRNDVQSGATVPHGVKTVQPGEGLQLVPPGDGAEIFWDWETANEYETRIQEGRAAIEQARADLDQAQADLVAGTARLDDNERVLDALGPRVDAAESTVAQASKDLTAVSGRLDTTAGNLATLQGAVGGVQSKVIASDQKAADALAKAGAAQVSADGKNRITRATTPASQPGTSVGDTHFTMSSMGGGGVVTRQQRWDGSTWQDESVGHQVLASLDLGKATVGELDGAYIKANSILSNRVIVSAGENLIPDPTFLSDAMNASRTTGTAWRIGTAASGAKVLTTNSATQSDVPLTGAPDGWMQVDSTAKYQLQMLAGGPDQLSTYLMLLFVDGKSKSDGFQWVRGLTGSLSPKLVEWDMTALGGPVAVRPMIRRNPTPSGATNYWQQIGAVTFRRKVNTVLIEDGAVTGDKVEAQTVAAKVGQFVKVQAQNVEVTEDLSTRVVNAMNTNTKNLVVTESAILQHTTLLGTTVADEINVRKLIRGRDAILSGTVDIDQLNVTGSMSAEIARFMDAEARKLIVTEDAILNRATVVEGLVTSELISKKANIGDLASRMITSGLMQTDPAANRGVKVDNNGIRAWDDAGRQTVNLNGKANYITGTFATAEKEQRVEIKSGGSVASADFFGSGNTVDHLGVWHQADAGDATASRIISQNGMTRIRENPGMVMWPFRGDFSFTGRWARNTDTVKMFSLVNYDGLPGGAWVDLKLTYGTPFPTLYSELIPVVSVESRTGAECIVNTRTNNAGDISLRVVNKSSNPTGVLYVRGFTLNFNTVAYTTTY